MEHTLVRVDLKTGFGMTQSAPSVTSQSRRFFSAQEIRDLARRSDVLGAMLVVHCWAVIIGAMVLVALWPNPLTIVLAIMVIGSRQLGLAILMHDAAHNALFRSPALNEWVGEWLCGRPILADLGGYRRYHLQHHRHTQTERDPDLNLSAPFPTTRASLRRKFWRDLTGQTGLKQRFQQFALWLRLAGDDDAIDEANRGNQTFAGSGVERGLLVNVLMLAVLITLGVWWLYPLLWVLPLLTWYQLVVRIRNIAEHGAVEKGDNPLTNVRTTKASWWERAFIAPYWVNYHLEHHLVMHVPCYNLPKLHRKMIDAGHGADMELGDNYWQVLGKASAKPG